MMRRFLALVVARNREFLRDRSAVAWNVLLPILVVLGFAFAFGSNDASLYKVGVLGTISADASEFFRTRHIDFIPVTDKGAALTKLKRHQLDMLIDTGTRRYWINDESARGYIVERVLHASRTTAFSKQTVSGRALRYVDWLIPGVLGMNMMFSALFGIGYVIVRYRKNGVLRRLRATPLSAFEFLAAQVASRLWLILGIAVFVFVGTHWFVDFAMFGSYFDLFLVFVLGAISLICLGLVVAARLASEELAGGLLNLISWPMMLLSGVWFSLEGSPALVQKIALAFPLTHVVSAARAIMIDGAGLVDIGPQLLVLGLMSTAFLAIAAITFRWE